MPRLGPVSLDRIRRVLAGVCERFTADLRLADLAAPPGGLAPPAPDSSVGWILPSGEVLPIGVMHFPGTGIQDNLADKAKKLGIPVWRFGGA